MPDSRRELGSLRLRQVVVFLACLVVFAVSVRVSADSDTWWHLLAGRWMIDNHRVLTQDPFSWTRAGVAWTDHSWLSEIGLFLLWNRWGFAGLNVAAAAVALLAWVFVYAQTEGGVYLRTGVVVLAAWASAFYVIARPELLSFALLSVFAYVLHLFRWHGSNRLWLLPLLMCAWVNLHGGFLAGFLLLGLTLAGQVASRAMGQRGPGTVATLDIVRLAVAALACVAATLINPYGVDALLEPLRTLSIPFLHAFVTEWQSPDFHLSYTHGFVVLLLVGVATLGVSRRRIDVTDLLLLSAFVVLALDAVRNIPLFALIAAPVITRHASGVLEEAARLYPRLTLLGGLSDDRTTDLSLRPAVLWAIAAVCTAGALTYTAPFLTPAANVAAIAETLPLGAVQFIRSARPPGSMFNSYSWGGYLAWSLYPAYPVYVDGRTDLYGGRFLENYVRLWGGSPEWRTVFRQQGIRLVVIGRGTPLAVQLRGEPEWREGYSDGLASVFLTNGPGRVGPHP